MGSGPYLGKTEGAVPVVAAWVTTAEVVGLTFTLPSWNGGEECQDVVGWPLTDLAEVAVIGISLYAEDARIDTLARADVRGMEGQRYTISWVSDGNPWSVWAITRDLVGNWSCHSPGRTIGTWPVGVPPVVSTPPLQLEYYDISGRRLADRPTRPGVYFTRQVINGTPSSHRKILILRN